MAAGLPHGPSLWLLVVSAIPTMGPAFGGLISPLAEGLILSCHYLFPYWWACSLKQGLPRSQKCLEWVSQLCNPGGDTLIPPTQSSQLPFYVGLRTLHTGTPAPCPYFCQHTPTHFKTCGHPVEQRLGDSRVPDTQCWSGAV